MNEECSLNTQVARLQVQVDAHEKRITTHGIKIDALNESVVQYHARTDEKLSSINDKLGSIGDVVDGIDERLLNEEARPANNWRAFLQKVAGYAIGGIIAILGGIVCVVLAQAGLKIL